MAAALRRAIVPLLTVEFSFAGRRGHHPARMRWLPRTYAGDGTGWPEPKERAPSLDEGTDAAPEDGNHPSGMILAVRAE
jgi:hypothetical protein